MCLYSCITTRRTPFRFGSRQYLDFTGNFEVALAKLRNHLSWLASPAGQLQAMKDRLDDAEYDRPRAVEDNARHRIDKEITELKQQIAEQQNVVDRPQEAKQRTEESITRAIERERQPENPVTGSSRTKFINPPPTLAPSYFQDRSDETTLIGTFLQDNTKRMMTIIGRGGVGKTALVCRVLKAVENGHLSDNGGPCSVDGIFYLTANGLRRVSFPHLYEDLLSLVPAPTAQDLEARYKDPHLSTAAKLRALLAAFPHGRVVVLLDNFEDVVGAETQEIRDGEMDEALHTVLTAPHYGVKIILTTRIAPRDFVTLEAGRQMRRDLDSGLESPYAENILREMDSDGTVGLKTAPDTLLAEARARTQGYPRALEALFGILAADRYTTLPELLSDPTALLPQDVVTSLVGEAFNRLDAPAQRVMQALAIYGRPVAAVAVDYLLQPYLPGVNSTPILHRLVNMHFVRRDKGYFSLHPVDRSYALARVPQGQEADRYDLFEDEPPFTRYALLDRAADYFTEIRKPREAWKTIHELDPQLAEFELRCEGEDYDSAALVLLDIDYEYLLLWGHYRLMIALHERLQGKLGDGELQQNSVGNLGTAHWRIGEITHAITCYQQALTLAREQQDRGAEAAWLGNLGNCLFSLILTFSRREKESSAYRQVCQFLLTLISFDHCLTSSLDK